MRYILSTLCLLGTISCNQIKIHNADRDKIISAIKENILKEGDYLHTKKIDSFNIVKIDMRTPAYDSSYIINQISRVLYFDSVSNSKIDSSKLVNDIASHSGVEGLNKWELDNYIIHANFIREYKPRLQYIRSLYAEKKIDTVAFLGYVVWYTYKGADSSNKEVKSDTLWKFFNSDYRFADFKPVYHPEEEKLPTF